MAHLSVIHVRMIHRVWTFDGSSDLPVLDGMYSTLEQRVSHAPPVRHRHRCSAGAENKIYICLFTLPLVSHRFSFLIFDHDLDL